MDNFTEQAIALLRRNGRASYSELARALGTTRLNIASRLTPMFADDSLRVVAATHPRLLGLTVLGYLSVSVSGPIAPVVQFIKQQKQPVFISEVTGIFQLAIELHTESLSVLREQARMVRSLPNVVDVQVLFYERVLSSFFLGEEPEALTSEVDQTDLALMSLLQHDGRRGYAELASEIGLSVSATRSRITRLISEGAMQIGVIRGRGDRRHAYTFGFGIKLHGPEESLVQVLQESPGLEFSARTVGRYDVMATLSFVSLAGYDQLTEQLRKLPEVETIESWLHVRVLLERYQRTTRLAAELRGGPSPDSDGEA